MVKLPEFTLLEDCLQIPQDEEFRRIFIYYYTDSPSRAYDAFEMKKIKEYDIPKEIPLFLCVELWEYQDDEYVKIEKKEELVEREKALTLIDNYLTFTVPFRKEDMNYRRYFKLKSQVVRYNLGIGCRWNRDCHKFQDPKERMI